MRYAYNISLVAALLLLAQFAYSQIAITGIQHSIKPEDFKDLCVGSIDLTAEGTAEPFTYQWSNGATTQDIQKLCIGLYTVTVTNRFGCSWVLESYVNNCENSFPPLELKDYKVTPISATGAKDGAIQLLVQGGVGETYYKWVKDGGSDIYATTKDINNLSAGKYCVTISGGCRGPIEKCFTIVSCASVTWDIKGEIKNECDCSGCNYCKDCRKGSIKLTIAQPASIEKTYQWSNGASVSEVKDLVAGSYTVTIYDKLIGCSSTKSFAIKKVAIGPEIKAGNCIVERTCEGEVVGKRSLGQSNLRYEFGTCNYPHIDGAQCIRWQYCDDTRIEGTCVYTGNPKREYDWNACKGKLVCSDLVVEEQEGKVTYKDQECGRTETCTITWNDGTTKEQTRTISAGSIKKCRKKCSALGYYCCYEYQYCSLDEEKLTFIGEKTDNQDPTGYKNCIALPECPPGLWDPNEDRSLQTTKAGSLVLQTNPNPFYDMLVFSYGQAQVGSELDIVILNAVGAVVYTQKAICEAVEGNIVIEFGNLLPSGAYRLLVKGGGHEFFYQKNLIHINR